MHRLSLVVAHGLLIAVASLLAERRLKGMQASGVVAHRLSHLVPCGIFPGQGLNPRPLRWKPGVLLTGPPGRSLFYVLNPHHDSIVRGILAEKAITH